MKVSVLLIAHPCHSWLFLTIKILEIGFVVFIRVVEHPFSFQILLVSLNLEVYNSYEDWAAAPGGIKVRTPSWAVRTRLGSSSRGELRCAHPPELCAQDCVWQLLCVFYIFSSTFFILSFIIQVQSSKINTSLRFIPTWT